MWRGFRISEKIRKRKAGLIMMKLAALAPFTGLQAKEAKDGHQTAGTTTRIDPQQETSRESAGPKQQQKIDKLSGYISKTYQVSSERADHIVNEAVRNAEERDLEPELVLAVVATESTFRPEAVSRAGARGLMQVIPKWHPEKIQAIGGSDKLFEVDKNIQVGTQILDEYIAMSKGDVRRGLLRYNGSLGKSSRYANKVMGHYNNLKRVT